MSTDNQIVEALAGHKRFPYGYCSCGVEFINLGQYSKEHRQHLAEVIEPIIRAREAEALREAVLDSRMVPGDPALRVLFKRANEIEATP